VGFERASISDIRERVGRANATLYKQAGDCVPVAFAAVQMITHVVFLLHVSARSEGGWTLLSPIFTLVLVVVITLAGSVWVMYHDSNMMPHQEMSQLP